MTYEGFGSPAWLKRCKGGGPFVFVTGPSDGRPPTPLDPYGTDPRAWTEYLNGLVEQFLHTGAGEGGATAHAFSTQMLHQGVEQFAQMLINRTFDDGPRVARQYAAEVLSGFIEEGSRRMARAKWEPGDRVRDKFKQPKPGDTTVTGRVVSVGRDSITVKMDDGKERVLPAGTFVALFERLDP